MSGTPAGAAKAVAKIRERYGVDADGKSIKHKQAGAIGGRTSRGGGFTGNPELARIAGRKGGLNSNRRGTKNKAKQVPEAA